MGALNKVQSIFSWNAKPRLLYSPVERSVVLEMGNGWKCQCPVGNVASAHWACCLFCQESHGCVWGFTGGFVMAFPVQVCILASHTSPWQLQLFLLLFCYCFWLWHHYHIPNSNPHPHNATLSHFSVLQQPHRGFDTIDSANFIVILQHEHLLVPHSGVVWCPSIHLAALFIVRKYHKAVVHNLRGLMRKRKLCRQIIWMSAVVNKQ